jgi:hypothetical protein
VAAFDIIDEIFVVADPVAVRRATCDLGRWRSWFPGLRLTPYDDRGLLGVRWRASGDWTGTAEVWLEEFGDGVIVHTYVRACDRLSKRHALAIKRRMTEVKDELEVGRPAGTPRVPLAERRGARETAPASAADAEAVGAVVPSPATGAAARD